MGDKGEKWVDERGGGGRLSKKARRKDVKSGLCQCFVFPIP